VRQLFTWRFVAAFAALGVLALLTSAVLLRDDPIDEVVAPDPIERRIDLIEPVFAVERTDGFEIRSGRTSGYLDVVLPGPRFLRIAPGTYGEIECDGIDEINQCAVFADMLGDAVVWFSIVPQAAGATAELPPIIELRDGEAIFDNGWRIPFAPVIERECEGEDILSFGDFLNRFGPDSTSIVDLETRQVVAVRCGADA
jgi:hypothetical protein